MSSEVSVQPGERLFARYAHAPNSLGYCGPADAAALAEVARGQGNGADVRRLARQFSGAWPYQRLIAEVVAESSPEGVVVDPLGADIGRAYWTGNDLTRTLDTRRLGELLLARFGSQAGHYWSHLTESLLDEVAPTHAFHVLGVYPWSRLLRGGRPEPLHVLDSCRIRVGEVHAVEDDQLVVRTDTLEWDGTSLSVSALRDERVDYRTADGPFVDDVEPGALVAIHWGFACDELTGAEAADLQWWTDRQVDVTNQRS